MKLKIINALILVMFVLCIPKLLLAAANAKWHKQYKSHVVKKAYAFANRNRFQIDHVNRDKYANCYVETGVEITLLPDGSVKSLEVTNPSLIPKADKYFSYIIKQTAPFKPTKDFFSGELEEVVVYGTFRLNIGLYENIKIVKPCQDN